MKKKINYWWLLILLTIVPYLYFIYKGMIFTSGLLAVYTRLFAPAIFGATVLVYMITFINRRLK